MEPQTKLTSIEESELVRLESIIEKGQQTFVEVGAALMEIKDSGLYKQHGTFEQYCKERWGYARTTAYYLIQSCKVIENVQHVEQGSPSSLRQTIPLSGLTPPQQQEAWKKAVDTAPEGKVTAKHVEKTAKEFQKVSVPKERPPEYGLRYAQMAIMDLEKIADNDIYRDQAITMVKEWIQNHERRS